MATVNFPAKRGDTFTIQLTIVDSNGVAIDITGYTFWFTIKSNKGDTDAEAAIQKTVTSHSDPTNGITLITVSASETSALLNKYYYDIQWKDTNNLIETILEGTITFAEDVTITTS